MAKRALWISLVLLSFTIAGVCHFVPLQDSVTEGSGYGFVIDASKQETYATIVQQAADGRFLDLYALGSRPEEVAKRPWLEEAPMPLESAAAWFDRYDSWSVYQDGSRVVTLRFEDGQLARTRPWEEGPTDPRLLELPQNGTHRELLDLFFEVQRDSPAATLTFETGWMARRQPHAFAEEELRLIEDSDQWALRIDSFWQPNVIRLRFRDGILTEIVRSRSIFEGP